MFLVDVFLIEDIDLHLHSFPSEGNDGMQNEVQNKTCTDTNARKQVQEITVGASSSFDTVVKLCNELCMHPIALIALFGL